MDNLSHMFVVKMYCRLKRLKMHEKDAEGGPFETITKLIIIKVLEIASSTRYTISRTFLYTDIH